MEEPKKMKFTSDRVGASALVLFFGCMIMAGLTTIFNMPLLSAILMFISLSAGTLAIGTIIYGVLTDEDEDE